MEVAILAAGLFVFLAHLLDLVFRRTKVPDILIWILLGVISGQILTEPEDPGTMQSALDILLGVGGFVAVVTLVVLLFEGGLGLKLQDVRQAAARATPFALVSMAGAIAGMMGVLHVTLGPTFDGPLDSTTCLLGALILGGTSSAVVMPLLTSLGTSREVKAALTLESALTDVLCIIGTVGVVTALEADQALKAGALFANAAFSLAIAAILGGLAGVSWTVVTAASERMKSNKLTTLAFALVVYGIAERMDISGAIAALGFGITLNNLPAGMRMKLQVTNTPITVTVEEMTGSERKLFAEVVFLLKAFFFFYLGLTVQPGDFLSVAAIVALLLAVVPFLPRYPAVLGILDPGVVDRREALLAWALVPRGLAAAVLAQYAKGKGIPGGEMIADVVNLMVFLSILLVAIAVFLIERGKLDGLGNVLLGRFPLAIEAPTESLQLEPEVTRDATSGPDGAAVGSYDLVVAADADYDRNAASEPSIPEEDASIGAAPLTEDEPGS